MLNEVKQTIAKYHLIDQGDTVLVGLSGGPDSVALLHLLVRLRRTMELSLHAVYINHGLRPKAAAREEAFCRRLCKKLKVSLTVMREDIPSLSRREKKSVEETAREVRYRLYEQLADEHGYNKIALGHHADDNVETILFHIIRGAGRQGLLGIPIRRGRIIRPLLHRTKNEVLAYLKKAGLRYCVDNSNATLDYSRNYIRNRLLVDIRQRLNPSVDTALLNLAELTAAEEEFLASIVASRVKKVLRRTLGGKIELDLTLLRNYDVWVRRRVLRHCISVCLPGATFAREVVDRLDGLAMIGGKSISLPRGMQAELCGDKLVMYRRRAISYRYELAIGARCRLTPLAATIRSRTMPAATAKLSRERRSRTVLLDAAKVAPPLVVRNIKPGDRFRPLGMKGARKVSDYLTDRKVGRVYRDEIPLVCDNKGIVWLVGFEIADRVKVDRTTREVLKLEFVRGREETVAAV